MTKITEEAFKIACAKNFGRQTDIATDLGVERAAITLYIQRHPEMQKHVKEARERLIDMAEKVVQANMAQMNLAGADRVLNAKWAEDRGWKNVSEVKNVLVDNNKELLENTSKLTRQEKRKILGVLYGGKKL